MPKFFNVPTYQKTEQPKENKRPWHGHDICVCTGCKCHLDPTNQAHRDFAYCEACYTCRRGPTGSKIHREHDICPSAKIAMMRELSE